ncbi:MAG TPA: O-antigen ligase family protein [Pyrinomonadaceae bacterium]
MSAAARAEGRCPHTPAERARHLLDRAIFLLLLALVFFAAVPYGSVDPWWEGAFAASAFGLGALWAVEGALGGRWLVASHRLLLPPLALLLYAFAQTLPLPGAATTVAGVAAARTLSADPFETWRFVLKLASLLLIAALMLRYTASTRRLRALAGAVVVTGCASALFGLLWQSAPRETAEAISPRLASKLDGYAQFINRNHFAFLAEMALGACGGLLLDRRLRRAPRLAVGAAALVTWAGLVLSNSRGGLLGMFAGLALAALLYFSSAAAASRPDGLPAGGGHAKRRASLARVASAGVLLLTLLIGVAWVGGERLAGRLESLPGDVSTEASKVRWGDRRVEIWGATWDLIKERPFAGAGFGAYRAAITAHHDASGEMSLEQAHNDYLELAASGGLVATLLAVWAVALFVARAWPRGAESSGRPLRLGALGGLAAVAVHSLFDFGLHVTANALLFVALACVAVVAGVRSRPAEDGRTYAEGEARCHGGGRARVGGGRGRALILTACCILLVAFFSLAARDAARAGVSRLLSENATRLRFTPYESRAVEVAEVAARLAPSDPEAYYALGVTRAQSGDADAARHAFEREAALRPDYYLTWLRLCRARERAGDGEGALDACRESVRLAPAYAEPRWQLGNALLRAGRIDEAFADLRRAAASRPQLFAYTIELAWRVTGGDAGATARAVAPRTASEGAALASFLSKRGEARAALEAIRAAGAVDDAGRRALAAEMIAAGQYREAFAVWSGAGVVGETDEAGGAFLIDGGFESQPGGGDAPGFGWRFAGRVNGARVSLDASDARGGARTLLISFEGSPDITARFVSQLLLTEPRARYRLSFVARTEELISGGPPVVSVLTPAGDRVLSETPPLPRDTDGWRDYSVEFVAAGEATLVAVRRLGCVEQTCPVFGRLWLDDFSLRKL